MDSTFVKSFIGGIRSNFKGDLRLKTKILLIESDDWGAIRTPSKESLASFQRQGFELDKSLYKVDALASQSDLEDLFDLLLSFKNTEGQHPVITANAIMANPDFQRIRDSDFKEYYFQPFNDTFKSYSSHQNNLEIWKKGMKLGIFQPQFHGREHLNLGRWMKALQQGDRNLHFSFDLNSTYSGREDYAFMEAYDWSCPDEVEIHKKIISEGLRIFEETFGFRSQSFIAPCYNWDAGLDSFLASQGIKCIQGIGSQMAPTGHFGQYTRIPHYFGKRNAFGSFYNIRNVFFEPVNNSEKDWTLPALARIQAAFLMNRPAVISTHRVNYVGYIDPKNKENGLKQLKRLLTEVLKKWPEVQFMSTDQLQNYLVANE